VRFSEFCELSGDERKKERDVSPPRCRECLEGTLDRRWRANFGNFYDWWKKSSLCLVSNLDGTGRLRAGLSGKLAVLVRENFRSAS
jgi:hypothetical protein